MLRAYRAGREERVRAPSQRLSKKSRQGGRPSEAQWNQTQTMPGMFQVHENVIATKCLNELEIFSISHCRPRPLRVFG